MLDEDNRKLEAECKRRTTARHSRGKSGVIPSQYVADYRMKNVHSRRTGATSGARSVSAVEASLFMDTYICSPEVEIINDPAAPKRVDSP
jgi:hypothetical protein